MSTLPVSDALQRLQNEALVVTVPRVGTMVRIPTPQDIRGFYTVREALESQAARLFAERARPVESRKLLQRAKDLDASYKACASSQPSEQELFDLRGQHMRFHLRLAEGANCPFLPENWHTDLATVLSENDPDAADRAMRKHVRFRKDELLVRLEPIPVSMAGIWPMRLRTGQAELNWPLDLTLRKPALRIALHLQ